MGLKRLHLINYCQHRDRQLEFHPGLTAIIGPNGSGKSNILGALRYVLTGANQNFGKLEQNVCQLANPGEPASVSLILEHKGKDYQVLRHLRGTGTDVVIENERIIARNSQGVTRKMLRLFRTDADLFNELAIVAQDRLFGFLRDPPARRLESLQRLFDARPAEACFDACDKHLAGMQIPGDAVVLDQLRHQLAGVQIQIDAIRANPDFCPRLELVIVQHAQLSQELASASLQLSQATRRAQLERELAVGLSRLAQRTAPRDEYVVGARKINAAIMQQQPEYEEALLAQQRLGDAKQKQSRLVSLQQKLAATRRRLVELTGPVVETKYLEGRQPEEVGTALVLTIGERLTQAVQKLREATEFIDQFAQTGLVACPTCGTPVANLTSRIDDARRQLPELTAACDRLGERYDALAVFVKARDAWQAKLVPLQQAVTADTAAVAELTHSLSSISLPITEDVVLERIKIRNELYAGERELQSLLTAAQALVVEDEAAVNSLKGQLAGFENPQTAPSVAYVAALQQQVSQLQLQLDRHNRLVGPLSGFEASAQQLSTAIAQAEETARQSLRLQAWQGEVRQIQGLFHREAAARLVIYQGMQWLQEQINQQLALFQSDFIVEVDENIVFTAIFSDGRRQPMQRLSAGQSVVLALSYRLCLNLGYAADVGFLCLDEPTAWLDEHHIRSFVPVLERLRFVAHERNLQCVIVTHEQMLAPLFDKVVSL